MIKKEEWLRRYAARVVELTQAPAEFAAALIQSTDFEARRAGHEYDPEGAAAAEVQLWNKQDEIANLPPGEADRPGAGRRIGRVAIDDRGNASFEWLSKTGSFRREIDTQQLRTLDLPFSIEDEPSQTRQQGSNPYDSIERPSSSSPRRNATEVTFVTEVEQQIRSRSRPK